MDDFSAHLETVQKITLFFLSLCFMGWALFPAYRAYVSGLIVGTVASWINASYLAWKIRQLSQAAIDKTNRKINLGFVTRASVSLLAVVLSIRSGGQIALATTLIGLFVVQLATLLLGFVSIFRKTQSGGTRGKW